MIFSIFRFFCTLRFQIFKYCPIITNHTSMEILFIQLSDDVYISIFFLNILMTGFVLHVKLWFESIVLRRMKGMFSWNSTDALDRDRTLEKDLRIPKASLQTLHLTPNQSSEPVSSCWAFESLSSSTQTLPDHTRLSLIGWWGQGWEWWLLTAQCIGFD